MTGEGAPCWLCGRPLGRRVERHHPLSRSRGRRETVAVRPLCHRTIHATLGNAELARTGGDVSALRSHSDIVRFLAWVEGRHPDFHVPTRRRG